MWLIVLLALQLHFYQPSAQCKLKTSYDAFNVQYFAGKLPSDNVHIVWSDSIERDGDIAGTWITAFEGEPESVLILISTRMRGCDTCTERVLLHEMAHVKLRHTKDMNHGKGFQREMRRLVKRKAFDSRW